MKDLETLTLKALVGRAQADRELALTELAATHLAPDDFADTKARALFVAIEARLRDGRELEALSLARATAQNCPHGFVADVVTGAEFLGLEPRARLLRENGLRRRAVAGLDAIRALLGNQGHSLASVATEVQRLAAGLVPNESDVRTVESDYLALVDKLESVQLGQREVVAPTGVEVLDFVLGGGLPATLTILAALPGVGKSALLATMAGNMAARGTRVGVLSLEDQRGWLLRRLAAQASAVPLFVLGKKPLGQHQKERIDSAIPELYRHAGNLVMSDMPGDIASVVGRARQMVAEGCRVIFVDHLGEVRLERSDRHDLDIANALSELRGIAKLYGVPVVVACHLKRRDGLTVYRQPTLTDFAFSAAVERMARVAIGLYLDEESKDALNAVVLKQTEGPANLDFQLRLERQYGLVGHTPVPAKLREDYGWAAQ